jgi:hypothetical protein
MNRDEKSLKKCYWSNLFRRKQNRLIFADFILFTVSTPYFFTAKICLNSVILTQAQPHRLQHNGVINNGLYRLIYSVYLNIENIVWSDGCLAVLLSKI